MYVLSTTRTLGLTPDEQGELPGTIEESLVLTALEELSAALPDHADLFIVAADQVRNARSAGLEILDADSVFGRYRASNEIQLRYRGEMRDVFTDLAIDLALRGVDVSEPDPLDQSTDAEADVETRV